MRITESKLRRIIKRTINEMSHDALGHMSRPDGYAGMGGSPSVDLNNRYLVAIAKVCMGMTSNDIARMCEKIIECEPSLEMYCEELPKQIRMQNDRGVRDCLYHICESSKCCEICIKCCGGVTF